MRDAFQPSKGKQATCHKVRGKKPGGKERHERKKPEAVSRLLDTSGVAQETVFFQSSWWFKACGCHFEMHGAIS